MVRAVERVRRGWLTPKKYASLESQVDEVVQRLRARVEELEEEVAEARGDGSSQAEEVRRLRTSLVEAGEGAQLVKEQMAMKVRWDAPRAEHLTSRSSRAPHTARSPTSRSPPRTSTLSRCSSRRATRS